jgi:hypothetical protein
MKKIFALISIVALLTACGGAQQDATTAVDSTAVVKVDSTTVKDTAAVKVDSSKVKTEKPVEKKK